MNDRTPQEQEDLLKSLVGCPGWDYLCEYLAHRYSDAQTVANVRAALKDSSGDARLVLLVQEEMLKLAQWPAQELTRIGRIKTTKEPETPVQRWRHALGVR